MTITILLALVAFLDYSSGQETSLPDYVVSECYGDIFNFDCGQGNRIRVNRDFFGYNDGGSCRYGRGDCVVSNPKTNSLIHRFCTGRRGCTYYLVERRACRGLFSNYQQVEYQCVPDSRITDVCSDVEYTATSTYMASPNFPDNYPPSLTCSCVVSAASENVKVRLEIVYVAIKYNSPCRDYLKIGRRKTCGTTVDLFSGKHIPVEFHSDSEGSHSGFWLHFRASKPDAKVIVRCGNATVPFWETIRRRDSPRRAGSSGSRGSNPFFQGGGRGSEPIVDQRRRQDRRRNGGSLRQQGRSSARGQGQFSSRANGSEDGVGGGRDTTGRNVRENTPGGAFSGESGSSGSTNPTDPGRSRLVHGSSDNHRPSAFYRGTSPPDVDMPDSSRSGIAETHHRGVGYNSGSGTARRGQLLATERGEDQEPDSLRNTEQPGRVTEQTEHRGRTVDLSERRDEVGTSRGNGQGFPNGQEISNRRGVGISEGTTGELRVGNGQTVSSGQEVGRGQGINNGQEVIRGQGVNSEQEVGRGQGVNNGHEVSPGQGFNSGHEVSRSQGVSSGQEVGLGQGVDSGQEVSRGQGANSGQEVSPSQGFNSGQEVGRSQGVSSGQEVGRGQGVDSGQEVSRGQGVNSEQEVSRGQGVNSGQEVGRGQGVNTEQEVSPGQGFNSGQEVSRSQGVSSGQEVGRGQGFNNGQEVSRGQGVNSEQEVGRRQGVNSEQGVSRGQAVSSEQEVGRGQAVNSGQEVGRRQGVNSGQEASKNQRVRSDPEVNERDNDREGFNNGQKTASSQGVNNTRGFGNGEETTEQRAGNDGQGLENEQGVSSGQEFSSRQESSNDQFSSGEGVSSSPGVTSELLNDKRGTGKAQTSGGVKTSTTESSLTTSDINPTSRSHRTKINPSDDIFDAYYDSVNNLNEHDYKYPNYPHDLSTDISQETNFYENDRNKGNEDEFETEKWVEADSEFIRKVPNQPKPDWWRPSDGTSSLAGLRPRPKQPLWNNNNAHGPELPDSTSNEEDFVGREPIPIDYYPGNDPGFEKPAASDTRPSGSVNLGPDDYYSDVYGETLDYGNGNRGINDYSDISREPIPTKGSAPAEGETADRSAEMLTLALIILCTVVGVGIFIIGLVACTICYRKKRRRQRQSEHTKAGVPSRQSSNSSSDQEGGSGRGLLSPTISRPIAIAPRTSYAKGTGHQSLLDIDSLYAKPCKRDKNLQIDMGGDYEDVSPRAGTGRKKAMLPYGNGDGNQIYATVVVDSNSKGTQARAGTISRETAARAKGVLNKRHKFSNHRLEYEKEKPSWLQPRHSRQPVSRSDSDSSTGIHPKPNLPPKPKVYLVSDSEPELFSGSEYEMDPQRKRNIASMSELAEVTFIPENTLHSQKSRSTSNSDETDWDNRSAISI